MQVNASTLTTREKTNNIIPLFQFFLPVLFSNELSYKKNLNEL